MKQREIKFRAWFPDLGVMFTDKMWVYNDGDLGIPTEAFEEALPKALEIDYDQDCVMSTVGEGHSVMKVMIGDEFLQFDKKQFSLMQFTGLKDKNGKEIYEGDIVKTHDHPEGIWDVTGEILYDHGHWKVDGSIVSLHDYGTAWTEVIGNIYE